MQPLIQCVEVVEMDREYLECMHFVLSDVSCPSELSLRLAVPVWLGSDAFRSARPTTGDTSGGLPCTSRFQQTIPSKG